MPWNLQHVGKLNTPKPDNVDELFKKLVGVKSLSSSWSWKGTSPTGAKTRLENLVALRGEIAHRVKAAQSVKKKLVLESGRFISRLAACSSNEVRRHVHGRTGTFPWIEVRYGGVR